MGRKIKLAYLISHPIQYISPLLRRISEDPDIELTVYYGSDFSINKFVDPESGGTMSWDIPLLDGYRYEFLPHIGDASRSSFWKPFNYGLFKRLKAGQFDVLWVHGYFRLFNWVAILIAKILGIKVFIKDDSTLTSRTRGIAKRIAKRAFFEILKKVCDAFLFVGSLNKYYYKHYGVNDTKLFHLPWAVDNAYIQSKIKESKQKREELRASLDLNQDRPIILYVGKLIERKRPHDLFEAYKLLSLDGESEPDPYLLYIGQGDLQPKLEQMVNEMNWTSVKFLGFKNQSELPAFYDLCDVFVLPSLYETWGLVVNEAMNAAKPIIVSDLVGSGPDLVKNSVNGYIYKAKDINALYISLNKVLFENNAIEMGAKSLEIINKWSYEEDILGLKKALFSVTK